MSTVTVKIILFLGIPVVILLKILISTKFSQLKLFSDRKKKHLRSVTQVKSLRRTDCGTDHDLVLTKV